MRFALSPDQFENLKRVLQVAPGVTLELSGANSGTLKTSDVTLLCLYDGALALYVTVTAKNSFKAKLAPESRIEAAITSELNGFIAQLA